MATPIALIPDTESLLITKEDQELARSLLDSIINREGSIPETVTNVAHVLSAVAAGRNITVLGLLTVEQACDFLDMEENNLLELLRTGAIVSREVEGERLVVADSLQRHKMEMKKGQRKALEEMADENQRMGLYD